MSEQKSPLEQLLDLLVYAPVGIAVTASEELPKMIEKGRTRITGQVAMARMMGQFAVAQGQQQAEKIVKDATERLTDLGVVPGSRPASAPAKQPTPATDAASGGAPARHETADAATTAPTTTSSAPSAPTAPTPPTASEGNGTQPAGTNGSGPAPARPAGPPAGDLAIPGYDSLSASQVVQRLAGLSGEELEAVRAYETANRGRKTILSRVAQLQSGVA